MHQHKGSQGIKGLGIVWLLTLARLERSFIAKGQPKAWCRRVIGICMWSFMIAVRLAIAHTKLQGTQRLRNALFLGGNLVNTAMLRNILVHVGFS